MRKARPVFQFAHSGERRDSLVRYIQERPSSMPLPMLFTPLILWSSSLPNLPSCSGLARWQQLARLLIMLLPLLLGSGSAQAALERVSDFAALDTKGEFHQLSRYKHRSGLALMTFDARCSRPEQIERFARLSDTAEAAGVRFALLDTAGLSRAALSEVTANLPPNLPVLQDGAQLIAPLLGARSVDEVLLLNPERLNVYFRGSDIAALANLIGSIEQTPPSDTLTLTAGSCALDLPTADPVPDYSSQVAPIILDNCVECHRSGGVGPFAMDSYIMLLGWSPMIKEVVLNKRMPPAHVDPEFGHSRMARYLKDDELRTLVSWIDARAPRGEGEEDPLEVYAETLESAASSGWQLGEPDFIVEGPSNAIPSTGVMDYLYEEVSLPFNEDRWLRAIETRPGDESVLHHLMVFVTAPDEDFWGAEREQETVSRRFVEGYAPGPHRAIEFAPGTGVLVPAGHKLSLQFHYVTNGQSTTDTTQLGLYFADADEALAERRALAVGARFTLPPEVDDFPLSATAQVDEAIVITGVRARMSYRGKKMRFVVERANGDREILFSVPAYNYGWQPHYLLDEPIAVAAGSRLIVEGALGNSVSNPTNPDPSREIPWGLESWEEMFTGYFTYYAAQSPDNLDPAAASE